MAQSFRGWLAGGGGSYGSNYDLGLTGVGPLTRKGTTDLLLSHLGNDGRSGNQQFDTVGQQLYAEYKNSGRTAAPSGGAGGGASQVLNQGAIDNTQKAIDSLGTEESVGRKNIDDSYGSLVGKYNKEAANTKEDYDEQTVTNTGNLSRNKQNALLAAAQGLKGLRGTLSAIGALSGDGAKLANQAARTGVNQDIGEATDTYATNAQSLDKAYDRFSEEDQDRRAEAETTRNNQYTALEGSIAGKKQNFFQKMAEIFSQGGNNAAATDWLNKAGDLNQTIAQKSAVQAPAFAAKSAAFTPGTLESYLAGAGDLTVDVSAGGNGGSKPASTMFGRGINRKKEDELAVA